MTVNGQDAKLIAMSICRFLSRYAGLFISFFLVSACQGADIAAFDGDRQWSTPAPLRAFYIDSKLGNDSNSGMRQSDAWRSLDRLSGMTFRPGDHIYLKREREFQGCLTLLGDGTATHPIVVGAYGQDAAPKLSNPDNDLCDGNAIQIRGDHQIVQNLSFHHTAPAAPNASFQEVWATGAVHASLGSDYAIIRGNDFGFTPKAIQSYSEYSFIGYNYIHGINTLQSEGFLSKPYWGPIGIQIGIGNQEIAHNIIEEMFVQGGKWGADGGAIEIDDGRNHKNNIYIHHNMSKNNMGFLEVSWEHDIAMRPTRNIVIEHNISRDYQSFVLWWAENDDSYIRSNTIIRTENVKGAFTNTVFWLDGDDQSISKNIIVLGNAHADPVFLLDDDADIEHIDNLYWNLTGASVHLGIPDKKDNYTANPQFTNFKGQDYTLRPDSPAAGLGASAQQTEKFNPRADGLAHNFAFEVSDRNN